MDKNLKKRIYVAGHRGLVGSAIVRALKKRGHTELVMRTHGELDLTNQEQVRQFFSIEKIDEVYLAAAQVGGIHANNTYPAQFIYNNLQIEANVIHQAWQHGVKRLLFLGSSCIYPRMAEQPIKEEALMTGILEPTNEPYAIAKIAGIKMCESYNRQYGTDYRSVMPTNLYGPGDNYHPENSHVIPALIRRFYEAKQSGADKVTIWGTGSPFREFIHVDDMAEASIHIMELDRNQYEKHTSPMLSHINVGTGEEVTIRELVEIIRQAAGFEGSIEYDASKPDGTPRKLMDSTRLSYLGWKPQIMLRHGIAGTYKQFAADEAKATGTAPIHAEVEMQPT